MQEHRRCTNVLPICDSSGILSIYLCISRAPKDDKYCNTKIWRKKKLFLLSLPSNPMKIASQLSWYLLTRNTNHTILLIQQTHIFSLKYSQFPIYHQYLVRTSAFVVVINGNSFKFDTIILNHTSYTDSFYQISLETNFIGKFPIPKSDSHKRSRHF